MDEVLDLLLEFLNPEDLLSIIAAVVVIVIGMALVAGGYFLNFSFLDEIALALGVLMVLVGIGIAVFQVVLEGLLG